MSAGDLCSAENERKVSIFHKLAGKVPLDVFNTFKIPKARKSIYEKVIKTFREYCIARNNETYQRFKFFCTSERDKENFNFFIKDLKLVAQQCYFGDQKKSWIKDRLILRIKDNQLQERVLKTPDLKLVDAEKLVRAADATHLQVKELKVNQRQKLTTTRRNKKEEEWEKFGARHYFFKDV